MIFWLIGCASILGPNLRTIQFAAQNRNTEKLVFYLQTGKFSYIRERAAAALRQVPAGEGRAAATISLTACLNDQKEMDFVRAQCALTLGGWGINESTDSIISALETVDGESRYWMAVALRGLTSPEAKDKVQSLSNDSDIYLSTSARQWLELKR